MSLFPRKKPDEVHELRRRIDTLEAVNRAQNVKLDLQEERIDDLELRVVELELVLSNILQPSVTA